MVTRWIVNPQFLVRAQVDQPFSGIIAQLAEHPVFTRQVVGSTPTGSTIFIYRKGAKIAKILIYVLF